MTYLLTVSSSDRESNQTTSDFSISFNPPLRIAGNWSMALEQASIWYSWYNISSDYGNQTFRYYNGTVWKNITITAGLYTIEDLNNLIQTSMLANGDYTVVSGVNVFDISLVPNFNTFKLRIVLSGGYQVDLTVGNIYQLFGFTQIIVTTTQEGLNNVNITNNIDRVLIHCDVITGSYQGGRSSDVMYSFSADGEPSSLLQIKPNRLLYLPINQSGYLYRMRIRITDQLDRVINLNGEEVSLSLYLKGI